MGGTVMHQARQEMSNLLCEHDLTALRECIVTRSAFLKGQETARANEIALAARFLGTGTSNSEIQELPPKKWLDHSS